MRRRAVCLSVSKRNEPNMDIIENMAMIWNVPVATAVLESPRNGTWHKNGRYVRTDDWKNTTITKRDPTQGEE